MQKWVDYGLDVAVAQSANLPISIYKKCRKARRHGIIRPMFVHMGPGNFAEIQNHDEKCQRHKGFAFIEMDDLNLPAAISALNGAECEGRNIVVNEAKEARRETTRTN